ncbi:hypothetical protein KBB96_11245 [Luteolibacter ambystomatis]|uniref:Uncharacterized protein n=1 Tax=Luteolibacter ambystomatis TaxID=2824561 RepID=A0A975G624_9BACT|nr:hypothetical protein [Luteolibacter ambystomatis]QUE49448.1 hypothetical protein KBB96_11245 [Luteolibacter ambystomatis]
MDHRDAAAEEAAMTKESHNVKQRDKVTVTSATLSSDGRTVELALEGMKPSMQLQVGYDLEDKDGNPVKSNVTGTVYVVP